MRVLMCVALLAATMAQVMAARAQQSEDQRLCRASTGVSREQRLKSCTAVIKARLERPKDHFNNQNLATAYNNRGNVYLGLRDYDRAIADYDRAVELDPHYPGAFYRRGDAYRRKGRY